MKILVTNPTGRIGRRIVPELLAPEFSLRVLARDPARLLPEIRRQVEVVRGSSDDAATLRRALDGVEALFWCVPTESMRETNVERHYERFARAGWQAIRQAGTLRVVTISASGKGLSRNPGPISHLHAMEETLNDTGTAIRHLRCAFLMENFLEQARSIQGNGLISYPLPGHVRIPMTATIDVADSALRWLVRRDWSGIEGVPVHGPEDLSGNQAAAVIGQILEWPVQYRETSPIDYVRSLVEVGASTEFARSRLAIFSALAQGVARAEPRTIESTTLTSLAAWTRSDLLPAIERVRNHTAVKTRATGMAELRA